MGKSNLIVGQSGGPTVAINSSLCGVIQEALAHDEIGEVLRRLGVTHLLWNGAEAQRIAAAEGRPDFLACKSIEARARLDRFLSEGVTPLAAGATWEIGAVAPD